MKIGIDIGAMCGERHGNYIFTINLVKELIKSDRKNAYFLYSFCNKSNELKLSKNFVFKKLLPKQLWINGIVRFEDIRNQNDFFLGLNQAFPKSKSKKIEFSHGLSFIKFKNYYPDSYNKMLNQVKNMINTADCILVSSIRVKQEFEEIFNIGRKVKVLNYGIPYDFQSRLPTKKKKYFL